MRFCSSWSTKVLLAIVISSKYLERSKFLDFAFDSMDIGSTAQFTLDLLISGFLVASKTNDGVVWVSRELSNELELLNL